MAQKKIIIIGAGISGLSAGCYARMNGYDVEIHESHTLPGGLCTGWKRGAYWVDGCIHWLTCSRPGSDFYDIWEELGAVQNVTFYDHEIFSSFVGLDGRRLNLYANVDRLEAHLTELSPQDAPATKELCRLIRRLGHVQIPCKKATELMGPLDGLALTMNIGPYLKDLMDVNNLTLGQLAARFKDPLLSEGIARVVYDETLPASALLMTQAWLDRKDAGFPLGGSLAFATNIEKRFLDLGGRVFYRSRVAKIIEHNGQVRGVRLENGEEIGADIVISACDLEKTLYSMLDGSRVDPLQRELLETGKTYPPLVMVTFGVDMDFSADITCVGVNYLLEKPLEVAGRRYTQFTVKNYSYDPSMAPAGKSVVGTGFFNANWDYWAKLPYNSPEYCAAKDQVLAVSREYVEKFYPGFNAKIEMMDVATPHTFANYTGNRQGIFMTWQLDGAFQRKHPYIPKTVPGLAGLYLASMWTKAPGGIPGAAQVGREVVQVICKKDGKKFAAFKP